MGCVTFTLVLALRLVLADGSSADFRTQSDTLTGDFRTQSDTLTGAGSAVPARELGPEEVWGGAGGSGPARDLVRVELSGGWLRSDHRFPR